MANVEVRKTGNENNVGLIRRFTKRVQGSGILPRLRSIRYQSRTMSDAVKKKRTLKQIRRREEVQELIKQGKLTPHVRGQRRR